MKYLIAFIIFLIISIALYINFIKFGSAFEADQACHFELSLTSSESSLPGCDHDIETHQWILYEIPNSNEPAKVIKRYRY
tara:strand:- start:263 stop:502 length:240 start_codon:yes stop_codon:yes gene_type:complete